jgi:long-chain acyl-CoA synthetase
MPATAPAHGHSLPATLGGLLAHRAATTPDAAAVLAVQGDGSIDALDWSALLQRAQAAGTALAVAGLGRAEPVALIGPSGTDWIVAYFGILAAGGLPVLLDAQAAAADLAAMVANAGARRAITTPRLATLLAAAGVPALQVAPLAGIGAGAGQPLGNTPDSLPPADPGAPATLLYTSGTTGCPKGVPLSHGNLLANVAALAATGLVGPGDRVLLPLPLHHAYPLTVGLLGCVATGAALVLPAGVTGPQLAGAIRGTGATVLVGVPRLFSALLAGIEARAATGGGPGPALFRHASAASIWLAQHTGLRVGRLIFSRVHRELGPTLRLLVSGGAPLEPGIAVRLEGLGYEVLSGYGLSETAPVLTFNVRGHVRQESVGRALPGVELRIGEAGEVQARGPNVFAGYLRNADATRLAFTPDGWFRTGDLGRIDTDGYLQITGRLKELIVLADGKKLLPEAVEQAYAASPLMREVGLFELDGQLAAVVVPDEAAVRARGAVREAGLLREELETIGMGLPAWQRLAAYRIVDAPLPRTTMGKLQRFRLPDIYRGAAVAPLATGSSVPDAADQALLEEPLARVVWQWLCQRFAGKPVTLDASPQLDLQVDSLEWLALTLEIRGQFGVALDEAAIARVLTVRDLLREVLAAAAAGRDVAGQAGAAAPPDQQAGPPGLLLAAFGAFAYAVDRLLMRSVFRLHVEGADHLPRHGPLIIAPNHASYLDPLAIAAALPPRLLPATHWAGWTQLLFKTWHWRLISRATRVFPVDPDRGPAAALAAGQAVLARGDVLVWFPEGRRSRTGEPGPFLPGIGVLLARSGCAVVPAWIEGTFHAWPWNARWPRPARVTVRFGPPVTVAQLAGADPGAVEPAGLAAALGTRVGALGGYAGRAGGGAPAGTADRSV